jgi:hypothetical protein
MNPVSAMSTHSTYDQLKDIDWAKVSERRSLLHVQKSDDRDEQGNEDACGDVPIPVAHFAGARNERHVTCPCQ